MQNNNHGKTELWPTKIRHCEIRSFHMIILLQSSVQRSFNISLKTDVSHCCSFSSPYRGIWPPHFFFRKPHHKMIILLQSSVQMSETDVSRKHCVSHCWLFPSPPLERHLTSILTFSSANHITGWCALSVAQGRVRNAALQYIAPSIFAQLRRGDKKERNVVFQYFSLSIFAQLRRWEKKDAQGSEAHRHFASDLRGAVLQYSFIYGQKMKKEKIKNLMHRLCASDIRGAVFQYCCKTDVRHLWGHRSPSCRVKS